MKILVFNTLYHPNVVGGAEKSVQLLAEGFLENGHETVIVSTGKEDKVDFVNNIKVHYLQYRNLYWGIESKDKPSYMKPIWHLIDSNNPLIKPKISEIIKNENPDIIFTNNLSGISIHPWTIAKERNIPIVHTLRDYSLMCIKSGMFKNDCNCVNQCNVCSLMTNQKKYLSNNQYVDYLIGNSEFIIKRHKEVGLFNNVRSKRIFNGAVLSDDVNRKFKSANKKLKFFYMGRIDNTKGVDLLLDVFTELDDIELILAGKVTDKEIEENNNQKKYPKNIQFLGFIKPEEILPEIDVMIIPSKWHEPLPRVALEAYSYNKIVIGSNRGGTPEVVIDGVTGLIFNPSDRESLISCIKRILENPRLVEEMKENIPEHIKKYDINLSIQEYLDVFNIVINEKSSISKTHHH